MSHEPLLIAKAQAFALIPPKNVFKRKQGDCKP
jgi:hypothetical protein